MEIAQGFVIRLQLSTARKSLQTVFLEFGDPSVQCILMQPHFPGYLRHRLSFLLDEPNGLKFEFSVVLFRHLGHLDLECFYCRTLGSPCPMYSLASDVIVICTNTMHKMALEVMNSVSIPLLHIADATANKIISDKIKKVALLGTAFTMEEEFYKGRLINQFGLEVMVPDEADRVVIHDIIYHELCLGIINEH